MATYATRACKICGIKLPQNRMVWVKQSFSNSSSRSQSSVGTRTFIGLIVFGDSGSAKAIKKWVFDIGKRTSNFQTEKTVLVCHACSGQLPRRSIAGNQVQLRKHTGLLLLPELILKIVILPFRIFILPFIIIHQILRMPFLALNAIRYLRSGNQGTKSKKDLSNFGDQNRTISKRTKTDPIYTPGDYDDDLK